MFKNAPTPAQKNYVLLNNNHIVRTDSDDLTDGDILACLEKIGFSESGTTLHIKYTPGTDSIKVIEALTALVRKTPSLIKVAINDPEPSQFGLFFGINAKRYAEAKTQLERAVGANQNRRQPPTTSAAIAQAMKEEIIMGFEELSALLQVEEGKSPAEAKEQAAEIVRKTIEVMISGDVVERITEAGTEALLPPAGATTELPSIGSPP